MSTISVRIDETLVDAARTAAKAEFRTVQGQVEFWAKVGRAADILGLKDLLQRRKPDEPGRAA